MIRIFLFLVSLSESYQQSCPAEETIVQSGLPTFNLQLNKLSQSSVGICHYHLETDDGHGALSISPDKSKSGYYTSYGRTYTLTSTGTKPLKSELYLGEKKSCQKIYEAPHGAGNHLLFQNRTRLRRDTSEKYIELIMVVSHDLVNQYMNKNGSTFGDKVAPVLARYEMVHNTIDSFYKTAGIRVALLDIQLWKDGDLFEIKGKNSGEILDAFRTWRRGQPKNMTSTRTERAKWSSQDNAQLVVPHDTFESPTIGKGWTNAFCESYSAGVNEDHMSKPIGLATTMAHEMGHNVGLNHDTEACDCPAGAACIMEASSSPSKPASEWSSCSKERLEERKEFWPCMDDIPDKTLLYGTKNCGNGIVELEEDCDCGDRDDPDCTACCNKTTCMFKDGADCSDVNGPCCKNCKLMSGGTTCRERKGTCDLPEYCDGYSSRCPANVFVRNGEECDILGRCMAGSCLTKDTKCQYLYGPQSTANEQCMEMSNTHGNRSEAGNCGESFTNGYAYYYPCHAGSEACGKVSCVGGADKSIVTELSDVTVGWTDRNLQCKYMDWTSSHTAASGNQFYNIDRMPMGTPCGEEKVCYPANGGNARAQCSHLKTLWTPEEWGVCTKNCSGNGICNSNGNCHCDDKFGGVSCDQKGYGGSIDSNRANYQVRDEGTVMFASIFSVLFAFIIIGALIAKFHFGRNLTDIFFYQPCAGNKNARDRTRSFEEPAPRAGPRNTNDPFQPDWEDSSSSPNGNKKEQIYVEVIDRSLAKKGPNGAVPLQVQNGNRGSPNRPPPPNPKLKPKLPEKPKNTGFMDKANTTNPFKADWSDTDLRSTNQRPGYSWKPETQSPSTNQRPMRTAPAPPKAPTPPPPDY